MPAPTYETATTRKYRLGRTETLRSCSNEAVAFVKGMDNSATDIPTKRQLLRTALVIIIYKLFSFRFVKENIAKNDIILQ
jgi:hypothetical protein